MVVPAASRNGSKEKSQEPKGPTRKQPELKQPELRPRVFAASWSVRHLAGRSRALLQTDGLAMCWFKGCDNSGFRVQTNISLCS